MDRASSLLLSWLLIPVAAVLVLSALSLPRQPYTGLVLRGDRVATLVPGSPGERAGVRVGDRLAERRSQGTDRSPLAEAFPNRPLALDRFRDGTTRPIWLVPEPLPDGERRMMAAMLAVASGFVLLGGWVWSERRDQLTRAFFLLCVSFAWLIAPLPRWGSTVLTSINEAILGGIVLFLPALSIHFFALFPESRARGRRWPVLIGYLVATALFIAALATRPWRFFGVTIAALPAEPVQIVAAVWFAAGLLTAFTLFAKSYARAGSPDARRRLRVALIGTALGAGPLVTVTAIRNLSPETAVPGERWAVVLTLLVPASFAWATVVHRIFDFRVALRVGTMILLATIAAGLVYGTGEWLAASWWPDLGAGIAGAALAFLALTASFAGPLSPWLHTMTTRVVRGSENVSLLESVEHLYQPADDPSLMLAEGCEAVTRYLRLDGCLALRVEDGRIVPAARAGAVTLHEPGPGLAQRAIAALATPGVRGIDEVDLGSADREALEFAGFRWMLPVGVEPVRAVILLGRRLAGSWLGRSETAELERFAEHLSMTLENAALRFAATTHGRLDRELEEAGAIQAHLLPRRAPIHPTLDCAAAALSCEMVGGDYYDFVEGPGRDFTLAVGDAAGHGMPAALLLAGVQARFRSEARRGLHPGQLLHVLNEELVGLDQPEKFVGLMCAHVEVRGARVWIANAGLTPPLVRRRDGTYEEVTAGGVLLGVSERASYPDVCVQLGAGEVLLLYTDGLSEARRGEELFGSGRIQEVIEAHHARRAADIIEALLGEVRAFADRPLDDITVVVLRQLTSSAPLALPVPQKALKWSELAADGVM